MSQVGEVKAVLGEVVETYCQEAAIIRGAYERLKEANERLSIVAGNSPDVSSGIGHALNFADSFTNEGSDYNLQAHAGGIEYAAGLLKLVVDEL